MKYLKLLQTFVSTIQYEILKKFADNHAPFLTVCSLCYFFRSVHKIDLDRFTLYICCMSLTGKFHSDFGLKKKGMVPWSKMGCISLPKLQTSEMELLKFLGYQLEIQFDEILLLKKHYYNYSKLEGIKQQIYSLEIIQ